MAYISSEQREANKQKYDEVVYQIFITEGWDAVTYQNVANKLSEGGKKLPRSTLQRYYPSRIDFGRSLQGKVAPHLIKQLDLSSKEAFIQSWMKALDDKLFMMVVRMLIENAFASGEKQGAKIGVGNFMRLMSERISKEEVQEALEICLGKSILYVLEKK
ncbi:TetR/AcrR family transcriptional regulator [Vibrio tubiashii]|uniref:TetR/AcrR family transcriptional regulator n=1 Tax=Vibrio tubiashii TaxID=29498 RepID=UPI00349E7EE4